MIHADPSNIVTSARSWLGTPYHDQASLRGVGVDCLGLARGVWRMEVGDEPLSIPPYSRDWGETNATEVLALGAAKWLIPIDVSEAGAGSVVLFRMVRGAIAKHVGILTGEGTFIHAYQGIGVIEEALTQVWQRRIAFAFAFPAQAQLVAPEPEPLVIEEQERHGPVDFPLELVEALAEPDQAEQMEGEASWQRSFSAQ